MRVPLILAAIVAALLLGCGQVAQKAAEQAAGVKIDQKGDTVTYGKDGNQVTIGSGARVPDELKDLPVPQGFTTEGSFSVSSSKTAEGGAMASWRGRGTVASVLDFYKKALTGQGWKEEGVVQMGDAGQLVYTKGDDQLWLQVAQDEQEVTVQVVKGKKS